MSKKVVSVSDVNKYVARLLEEDYMLSDFWIGGEVSNCKYHQSGHIYFTIKDASASIPAVMFARDASNLSFKLTEGLKIFAKARISLYQKTGAYQAYIYAIEKQGLGELYEKFERLKNKLMQEGLFDSDYKKKIPTIPQKVGVITSRTGAAIEDIIHVAKRRNPSIPIYIYPTHVQGDYAKDEIVVAIEKANEDALVDVLIVGRGGGSMEDLWPFNEECVARAIFNSKIPIVSAVGHEIDFTIADFVSDLRAPTPSAAAEMVFPSKEAFLENLLHYKKTLKYMLTTQMEQYQKQLQYLLSRPVYAARHQYFENQSLEILNLVQKLESSFTMCVRQKRQQFETKVDQLEALSPLHTLKRGYALATKKDQQVLKSIEQVELGDDLEIRLSDGKLHVKVNAKGGL